MSFGLPPAEEVRQHVVDALAGVVVGAALAADYDDKAKADDYFEAFLLATLLQEAQAANWTVDLVDTHGARVDELRLRAAPGSFSNPSQNYTHVVLTRRGAFALEIHVGVRVRGSSGVLHEADLLLLPQAVAEACRDGGRPPEVGQTLAIFEAKFIDSDSVPLGYGRGFLGLDTDLRGVPSAALVTTRPSESVDQLLAEWHMRHLGEILPSPGTVEDDELREYLSRLLEWWSESGQWWRTPALRRWR